MKKEKTEKELLLESIEAMPLGVVVFGRADDKELLRVVAANGKFCQIAHMEPGEIVGKGFLEIFPGSENWQSDIRSKIISIKCCGDVVTAEEYIGPPVRKWISIKTYKTESGNPVMIIEDVTKQSRAKQALQRQRSHITF